MTRFPPLPQPMNAQGDPRRVGVEIELGNLNEDHVAELAKQVFGGNIRTKDTVYHVEGTDIGDLEIYLDTALTKARKSALRDMALDLGHEVIPVEIVTEPLDMDGLEQLDDFTDLLRREGATGSGAGILLGFGVHLNVEITSEKPADILRPLMAYALIEDWMRKTHPIDESRRLLPFTAPYPTSFVRALIALGPDAGIDVLTECYLAETPSRNHGLDMFPLLAHLRPDAMSDKLRGSTKPRPAFHFRLPDCRIDDPDWSLAEEWRRWLVVERVAANADLLTRLSDAWLDDHGPVTFSRTSWAARTAEILPPELETAFQGEPL